MDVENKTETVQEQLPQIRRITTLDEVKRIEPARISPPPVKKEPRPRKFSVRLFLIGLIFFSVLGIELAIIYRYDKLNKRLYQISVALKDEFLQARSELENANKVKAHIAKNRNSLLQAYRQRGSLNDRLGLKENSYRRLLASKASMLGVFQGDSRVATARIEALRVQQELLINQIKEKSERVRQLTTQLINNIGEQEILVNKNLKLQEERDQLARELAAVKAGSQPLNKSTEE